MTSQTEALLDFLAQLLTWHQAGGHLPEGVELSQVLRQSQLLLGSTAAVHALLQLDVPTSRGEQAGLTLSDLQAHMVNHHGLEISAVDQMDLLNMGYYHGYKRYRYVKKMNRDGYLRLTRFEEIRAIYHFDQQLKALFYPLVMQVETALKNRVLAALTTGQDSSLAAMMSQQLMIAQALDTETRNAQQALRCCQALRTTIYDTVTYFRYKHAAIAHYQGDLSRLPLWAYFEVITLGQFSQFLAGLQPRSQALIAQTCQLLPDCRQGVQLVVNSLIELRNAIMHNGVIFDANFPSGVPRRVKICLASALELPSLQFRFIEDYLILLIWLASGLQLDSELVNTSVHQFEQLVMTLDQTLKHRQAFSKIVSTSYLHKLKQVQLFLDKNEDLD